MYMNSPWRFCLRPVLESMIQCIWTGRRSQRFAPVWQPSMGAVLNGVPENKASGQRCHMPVWMIPIQPMGGAKDKHPISRSPAREIPEVEERIVPTIICPSIPAHRMRKFGKIPTRDHWMTAERSKGIWHDRRSSVLGRSNLCFCRILNASHAERGYEHWNSFL